MLLIIVWKYCKVKLHKFDDVAKNHGSCRSRRIVRGYPACCYCNSRLKLIHSHPTTIGRQCRSPPILYFPTASRESIFLWWGLPNHTECAVTVKKNWCICVGGVYIRANIRRLTPNTYHYRLPCMDLLDSWEMSIGVCCILRLPCFTDRVHYHFLVLGNAYVR